MSRNDVMTDRDFQFLQPPAPQDYFRTTGDFSVGLPEELHLEEPSNAPSNIPTETLQHYRVAHILELIRHTRQISRDDQRKLMAALLSIDALTPEEQAEVDHVFEELRTGLVRVVN
jgi:hypothetical protein